MHAPIYVFRCYWKAIGVGEHLVAGKPYGAGAEKVGLDREVEGVDCDAKRLLLCLGGELRRDTGEHYSLEGIGGLTVFASLPNAVSKTLIYFHQKWYSIATVDFSIAVVSDVKPFN